MKLESNGYLLIPLAIWQIARTDAHDAISKTREQRTVLADSVIVEKRADQAQEQPIPSPTHDDPSVAAKPSLDEQMPSAPVGPSVAPAPTVLHGPTPAPQPENDEALSTPPASPYTTERALLRNLTMPTHPNFNIPSSPSPPPQNSEEAATLTATTKKFERFLELKKQGVHFNARLENSASLRNPSLLPKLMEFAGMRVEEAESYASTLGEGVEVPARWPEEWYVENLSKENERRERKAKGQRTEVGFVREKGAKEGRDSKGSTPGAGGGSGSEHRKSKFARQ